MIGHPGHRYAQAVELDSYATLHAIPRLRTKRLLLREFQAADVDALAAMHADPEVMRHIGEGQVLDHLGSWRSVAVGIGHWQLLGYGMWAVCDRETGRVMGRCGFLNPPGWPGLELGWLLGRPYWGSGYAIEAAQAALEHGWTVLGVTRLISLIRPDNARSIALAERLGAVMEKVIELLGGPVEVWVHTPTGG
ncbi:MAG: GNAT family N-acetyltransferase [Candidatus Dormibacteria bacterium]